MISKQVRRYAEDPAPNNPNLPPEMIVLDERFSIFLGLAPTVTLVGRLRLQDEDVPATVEEISSDRGGAQPPKRVLVGRHLGDPARSGGATLDVRPAP